MSEKERMDRAERIRRMREGRRGNGGGDDAEEADEERADETPDASATDETEQLDDDAVESGGPAGASTATTTEPPAETGDGDADSGDADVPDTDDQSTADEAAAADAEVDDVVADAVERISGASASLPDAAAVDDDSEVSDASVDDTDTAGSEATVDAESGAEDEADQHADAPAESAEPAGESETESESAEQTRVLEFTLDDEQYCLDIAYIEEIVKNEHITRVPNTPAFVEGVVDMRGQITTILNPKIPIEKEDTEPGKLIVVFDAEAFDEQGYLGWVVDDVRQVSPVTDAEVNHPPMDEDYINGIIDRDADDEFVIWTTPDLALDEAA